MSAVTQPPHCLLSVRDLAIDFALTRGRAQAVRQMNLAINAGTTVALVGESGSGKSVTAQAIMGILPSNARLRAGAIEFQPEPESPRVDLAQLDTQSAAFRAIRGGQISMIFQEPMVAMSPVHTVGDQILEAVRLHQRCSAKVALDRVLSVLRQCGFSAPERVVQSYPFELSGGMRQRAVIAMAMVCQPRLLIADEPTTALDVTIQAQTLALMKTLQAEYGTAILLITHDMGVVANMADEVVTAYRGEVVEAGTREEVFLSPQHPYLRALLAAVPRLHPLPLAEPSAAAAAELDSVLASGTHLASPHALKAEAATGSAAEPVLRVRELERVFASRSGPPVMAVNQVSFELYRGECLGVVGESGCGKSTLTKLLTRAIKPSAGAIEYQLGTEGFANVHQLDDAQDLALRRRLQLVFQDPYSALNPRMTVAEILTEPLSIHRWGSQAERLDRARAVLAQVQLPEEALMRYPHSFSGGQRQRVSIARALMLSPECLLLDEPVSALDVTVQAQVLAVLTRLQRSQGLSYLFIAHNLAVVRQIADRIAVMCRGRIVELAPAAALIDDARHPYTQALVAAAPSVDLAAPMDFSRLRAEDSQPERWPAAFALEGQAAGRLREVSPGHWLRFSSEQSAEVVS